MYKLLGSSASATTFTPKNEKKKQCHLIHNCPNNVGIILE